VAQTSVIVVSLAMLGSLGGLAYVHAKRDDSASVERPSAAPRKPVDALPALAETRQPQATPAQPSPVQPSPAPRITSSDVERWITDSQSNDAKTRAAAIESLAKAPMAQALPALERVLESGEPQIDRQIALRSLHVLALNDGDDTGAIRDAIRHAMYHSDDEGVTQSAQAFLEDIEAALAEQGR
jgi:hypothetical protein